jgi:bleomycin hydrolase
VIDDRRMMRTWVEHVGSPPAPGCVHVHALCVAGSVQGEELPSKWRVENSWGRAAANAGYYVMTDKWFNEWMYQIAVDVSILPQAVTAVIEQVRRQTPPRWLPRRR